jgi:hypothetical protein
MNSASGEETKNNTGICSLLSSVSKPYRYIGNNMQFHNEGKNTVKKQKA